MQAAFLFAANGCSGSGGSLASWSLAFMDCTNLASKQLKNVSLVQLLDGHLAFAMKKMATWPLTSQQHAAKQNQTGEWP